MSAPSPAPAAAFFDVDGTLTNRTTLFRFLRHDMAERGLPEREFTEFREELRAMTLAGAPRGTTNRAFFRSFAGRPVAEVALAGRRWFRAEYATGGLFRASAVAALRGHVRAGHRVALVSGAFSACLDPLAELLGVEHVLCTRPLVHRGRYTGETDTPMLGRQKASAAYEFGRQQGIPPAASHAYGDHVSDIPLLELVGRPVAVGEDPDLRAHADRHGWHRLDEHGASRVTTPPSAQPIESERHREPESIHS